MLGRGLSLWAKDLPTYFGMGLAVHIPYAALLAYVNFVKPELVQTAGFHALDFVLPQVLGFVLSATIIHSVFQRLRGQRPRIAAAFSVGMQRLPAVLVVSILIWLRVLLLGLVGPIFLAVSLGEGSFGILSVFGLLVSVVGGIYAVFIYVGLWIAVPVAVVEKLGPLRAMRRSWELSRGERWPIVVVLVIFLVLMSFFLVVVAGLGALVLPEEWAWVLGFLIGVSVVSAQSVVNAVVYHDLRVAKEGVDTAELAAIFD